MLCFMRSVDRCSCLPGCCAGSGAGTPPVADTVLHGQEMDHAACPGVHHLRQYNRIQCGTLMPCSKTAREQHRRCDPMRWLLAFCVASSAFLHFAEAPRAPKAASLLMALLLGASACSRRNCGRRIHARRGPRRAFGLGVQWHWAGPSRALAPTHRGGAASLGTSRLSRGLGPMESNAGGATGELANSAGGACCSCPDGAAATAIGGGNAKSLPRACICEASES